MGIENMLIANGIFLLIVFVVLLSVSLRNGHSSPKVKEDIKKIRNQIIE